jgi:hypothetical protein
MNNQFATIMLSRGFTLSETGVWLSPDCKRIDHGIAVVVCEKHATATFKGGKTRYFVDCKSDMEKFRKEIV